DNIEYCFPIINVAESDIKSKLESQLIGKAVCKNIELLIGKEYHGLGGKKIAIMGYGRTGSTIAEELRSMGANITILDVDAINIALAKEKGYHVVDWTEELIKDSDIIIEATGKMWCNENEILEFKHGCYFLNASSKRLGINYDKFNCLIKPDSKVNLPGIGVRYTLSNDHVITLLADGYPINFFIGESVPDRKIAFILTMLFKSAELLLDEDGDREFPNGIVDTGLEPFKSLQQEIANMYRKLS
ncbi:MAG TPA: NAD(P)-dependent oxidoreductase, partial [Candidatus Brocadiaceae bacterium]